MAPSNGFGPLTFRLTGGRSTRLSYDGIVVV
jgi:YD repeat-containing protein